MAIDGSALVGLRGLASLHVMVYHYVAEYTWAKVDVVGYLQIPTFFLLSGFCLTLGYGSQYKSLRPSDFYLTRVSRLYPIYLTANLLGLVAWQPAPVTALRWLLTLTMTNMWYPDPNLNPTFAYPAWTITTLSAFYLAFPAILSSLQQFSSHQLKGLITILFFYQLLSALLFFNHGCDIINNFICYHPLPRLPVFVMGVAAGLIRLHHEEETNKETTDNNNSNNKKEPTSLQTTLNQMAPFRIAFLDCSLKTIVDLCSLLLLSVPIFVQVFPPVQFGPQLNLFSVLANVLFVLPQLVVIIGLTSDKGSSLTSFVCRLPPLQFVGRVSLELYLLHDPVLKFTAIWLHLYPTALSTIIGCGLATLLLSCFFCRFFQFIRGYIKNMQVNL